MVPQAKSIITSALLIAATMMTGTLISACRKAPPPNNDETIVEQAGEPEQYSATVVRTIFNGTNSETTVTQQTRSGEKRRDEWTEGDQKRAMIWRPDLGKSFLLDLDRRLYVESDIAGRRNGESDSASDNAGSVPDPKNESGLRGGDGVVRAVDHYFDDAQSPARVETRVLSAVMIDSHPCKVYEQRTTFLDGHTETTRRFRADDLDGLALKIDCESGDGGVRVVTERRDVRIEAATDAFVVPPGFKRVDRLP